MDKKIKTFISSNKVLTLATSFENTSYCANCFYAFDEVQYKLIFLSESRTRHIQEAIQNKSVSGTIQCEVSKISKIQGIQFLGCFAEPENEERKGLLSIYYKKYPFAKIKKSEVWSIRLDWIKMTDNTLGFGTKLFWER